MYRRIILMTTLAVSFCFTTPVFAYDAGAYALGIVTPKAGGKSDPSPGYGGSSSNNQEEESEQSNTHAAPNPTQSGMHKRPSCYPHCHAKAPKIKSTRDTLKESSDNNETNQLQLQDAMSHKNTSETTGSNLLKKTSDTTGNITNNLR